MSGCAAPTCIARWAAVKTQCTELVKLAEMNEIDDGKVEVIGKDIGDLKEGETLPLGIFVQVAGREFQPDFEPILERQIHHLVNYIQGIMHIGQKRHFLGAGQQSGCGKRLYLKRYRRGAACQVPSGFPENRR